MGLATILRRVGTGPGRWTAFAGRVRPALLLLLTLSVVTGSWYVRAKEERYRVATASTIEDFQWVRQHLGEVPGLTLLDPTIAVTYPAIAGRPIYASAARPRPSTPDRARRAEELLRASEPDPAALKREGIGVVYRPDWGPAEGVREVRPGIFVVSAE